MCSKAKISTKVSNFAYLAKIIERIFFLFYKSVVYAPILVTEQTFAPYFIYIIMEKKCKFEFMNENIEISTDVIEAANWKMIHDKQGAYINIISDKSSDENIDFSISYSGEIYEVKISARNINDAYLKSSSKNN